MTKFERVGVEFQLDATIKADAIRSFEYSYACCCARGLRIKHDKKEGRK